MPISDECKTTTDFVSVIPSVFQPNFQYVFYLQVYYYDNKFIFMFPNPNPLLLSY